MGEFWHDLTKHIAEYLVLLGIFGFSFLGIWFFSYDPAFQTIIVIATGFSFVVWGIVHHHLRGDFHNKILWEYIATAVLSVIILLSLIWR